ncbi:MAG TPA: ATP-binding protein [Gemmataceae bacterium]|nr:ATP-binding protein [Gemmataceae bacterium]
MRSIRLSLIVYFLVLLTGALGAVSWFSYQTTAHSLRERETYARELINAQFVHREKTVRDDLNRRLLQKAHALANMRLVTVVFDRVHQGVLGFAQQANPRFSKDMFTYIDRADALIGNADEDHPQEYFQLFRLVGKSIRSMQRSESLENLSFTMPEAYRDLPPLAEQFDDVELKPGVMVRRVTLKAHVSGVALAWPRRGPNPGKGPNAGPGKGAANPGAGGGGKGIAPKGPPAPPRPFEVVAPTVFIQVASELGPIEAKVSKYAKDRDRELAQLENSANEDLRELRARMAWIGLASLAALWVGGFVVIRLGLAPLAKMSEAVSQVTPANFHLPLDATKLPNELQPIAERLSATLLELQKAFAREKQAAADISHELRTPLAALMTTLEVGLRKTRTLEEYREILEECRGSGQHMYQLVERLLTLARLDAGADLYRPADADVTELALSCADLIRPLARARGIDLRLHVDEPIVTHTDVNKLREILTNLLHNAVEYNKPDGRIDFKIERTNGHVRFAVSDTGIGIKPEALEHIFERFFRADPSRHADTPHAGLGLSIVKSYVELLGGTIRVASSDAGTTFTVEIPFVEPAPRPETGIQAEPAFATK